MATAAPTLPADKFDTSTTFVRPDPLPTRAPLDKLAVLPGFNTRVKDADYSERVATVAESIASHGFFDDKPFAVVMLPNDDTIYIFDGEHRFDAAKQAGLDGVEFPDGLPIAWAKDGATVKDLTIHLAHGNNGERLNMVELAAVVRRMQGLDMDKDEIAAALGRTTRHVDNLFVLAAANNAVKKAVASGQIAGAEAVKLLRKDKSTAAAKIAEHVAAAVAKGKAKATPKTMTDAAPAAPKGPKTKNVPGTINFPTGMKMGDLLKSLATSIRETVEVGDGDVVLADALIRFSVTTIDREAEAAAIKASEEKAAAAAERAKAAEVRQQEREAAAAKRAVEKAEAAQKREAEKAALAKAATTAAAAAGKKEAATKKAAAAKKPDAAKPAPAKRKTAAEAKAAAQAHLGGDKAAAGVKAAGSTEKPAGADSTVEGSQVAPEAGSASSAPETGPDAGLSDESMGGL